jgi:hemicentin
MCYLNNTIGNIHKLFNVVVQYPPTFVGSETTESHEAVKLHHGINLNCKVDGKPEPKVSWIFVS